MQRFRLLTMMAFILMFAVVSAPAWAFDAKKLVGTWSYEKTETNLTGKKPFAMKVFSEWLMTFNADGTYREKSKLGDKQKPEVSGTYQVQGDLIVRSENAVKMRILALTDRELVITSAANTKIFFKKK
ncbi:MAG: hypothetical protein KA369_09720 [Spirochaetes bacterium]|nr:hypothetical protein [Spirochaetota bacterium]